jgi:hypothetical protein
MSSANRINGGVPAVVAVAVIAAGVGSAAVLMSNRDAAPQPARSVQRVYTRPNALRGTHTVRRAAVTKRIHRSSSAGGWPAGFHGYTVALASDVVHSNAVNAAATARSAGLRQVGVLQSSRYSSLRPGYWFVYSGVYRDIPAAQREVTRARDAGFSDAYVRMVAE